MNDHIPNIFSASFWGHDEILLFSHYLNLLSKCIRDHVTPEEKKNILSAKVNLQKIRI